MLALLGFLTVAVFMGLILTKRMTALIALILVPLVFGVVGGFGPRLGDMILDGIRTLAPTGIMLTFAILYFGLMIDAGLFEPVIRRILRWVHGDPLKIVLGTAALALFVSLDGDGSTTYLITISAFLPLYKRLGLNPFILACLSIMAVMATNIAPWGGPTARVAAALNVSPSEIFLPMLPTLLADAAWVMGVAAFLGLRDRRRVGCVDLAPQECVDIEALESPVELRRPHRLRLNWLLTAVLMIALVCELMPLPALFMIAAALAMLINYPTVEEQKARIAAHAQNILPVVAMIFAAGAFTGLFSGTQMVQAMATSVTKMIPAAWGPGLPIVTALVSIPGTFFMSNDAFYFGALPIFAKAAAAYGFTPAAIGRASLVGQQLHLLSPLVPSTYLLVGLIEIDLGEHQRFTLKWALGAALVVLLVGLATTAIPLAASLP